MKTKLLNMSNLKLTLMVQNKNMKNKISLFTMLQLHILPFLQISIYTKC